MSYTKRVRGGFDDISYYHCIAHTIYRTEDGYNYALTETDKDMIVTLMKRLETLYDGGVNVLQYTIMDSHIHLILSETRHFELSNSEMKKRYEVFHQGKKVMDARTQCCTKFAARLNNISEFMRDLQWYTATFFNNARRINDKRRRGSLWNHRFRSCVLKGEKSLFRCALYIAMNPVRADMVEHAEDYKWGSWGERKIIGGHPHALALRRFFRNSEIGDDCFDEMEKAFEEALNHLEDIFKTRKSNTCPYSPSDAQIMANNSFWNARGAICQCGDSLNHLRPMEFIHKTQQEESSA